MSWQRAGWVRRDRFFAFKVGEDSTGLGDQQGSGGDIPNIQAAGPECVDAAGCEVSEIESSGPGALYGLQRAESGEESADRRVFRICSYWEAGHPERSIDTRFAAGLQWRTVECGTAVSDSGEHVMSGRIQNDADFDLTVVHQGDGDGVIREAVNIV